MTEQYPILEFDDQSEAIIHPRKYATQDILPEGCVLCFFYDVLADLAARGVLRKVGEFKSENGPMPIYVHEAGGQPITVMNPMVGAPIAAGVMEELIAHGCRKFIIVGGAGSLVHDLVAEHLVIPMAAVRDEGVSYHYLPPSREVTPDEEAVAAIEQVLQERQLPFVKTKTWTTSAFFRETQKKREMRIAEGCSVVEMEAAAFFAVAKYRGVQAAQLLYAGDLVVPEGWDGRSWYSRAEFRTILFGLALQAAVLFVGTKKTG
jgi:uridine phosphorylase